MSALPMLGSIFQSAALILYAILIPPHSVFALDVTGTVSPLSSYSRENSTVFHDGSPQYSNGGSRFTLYVKNEAGACSDADDSGWTAISGYVLIADSVSAFHERVWFLQSCGLLRKLLDDQQEGMKLRLCNRGNFPSQAYGCSETFTFRNGRWIEVDGRTSMEDGRSKGVYSIPLISKEDMINNRRSRLLHLLGRASMDTAVGIMDDVLFKERYIEMGSVGI